MSWLWLYRAQRWLTKKNIGARVMGITVTVQCEYIIGTSIVQYSIFACLLFIIMGTKKRGQNMGSRLTLSQTAGWRIGWDMERTGTCVCENERSIEKLAYPT